MAVATREWPEAAPESAESIPDSSHAAAQPSADSAFSAHAMKGDFKNPLFFIHEYPARYVLPSGPAPSAY